MKSTLILLPPPITLDSMSYVKLHAVHHHNWFPSQLANTASRGYYETFNYSGIIQDSRISAIRSIF